MREGLGQSLSRGRSKAWVCGWGRGYEGGWDRVQIKGWGRGRGWIKGSGKGRRGGGLTVTLGQLPHLPLLSNPLTTPHQWAMDSVCAGPGVSEQVPRELSLLDPPWFQSSS